MLVVVLGASILILLLMVVNALRPETVSPIPTRGDQTTILTPTGSATSTATITLTARPTWTLQPTSTVTITPTPTSTATATNYPTLTPVKPATDNFRYTLKPWTVTDAEAMAQQILSKAVFSGLPDVWYPAAAYAQAEALLRFPESLQANQWEWDLAASQS
jgi:hypothetical protein